jgi:hypothetical protein
MKAISKKINEAELIVSSTELTCMLCEQQAVQERLTNFLNKLLESFETVKGEFHINVNLIGGMCSYEIYDSDLDQIYSLVHEDVIIIHKCTLKDLYLSFHKLYDIAPMKYF